MDMAIRQKMCYSGENQLPQERNATMKTQRDYPKYTVTPKAEAAILRGHPWVYDAEVLAAEEGAENGGLVDVVSKKDRYLGTGFLSEHSKIRVRLISRNANDRFDAAFWQRKLRWAWDYREAVMSPEDLDACRIIFGEADAFPGLTVDKFHDLLSIQVLSVGMERIKWELEDLSLKYLDPVGYEEIVSKLEAKHQEYEDFMHRTQIQIDDRLNELGIQHIVYGRMKHPYSIYRKMFNQNKSLDEIFDLFAFRVIVENVGDCYNVLGVIHDLYKPILGRFKDYIGTPKPNGYQSLHTTVMGTDAIPFEVQIRTKEMHEVAEYGVAAHWKYKQGGQGAGTEGKYEWVRRLLENQEGADAEDYIHSLKIDMFADEVFVFTPGGDVQNLPSGATPIDFAYAIHSAVGNHMIGAKVNNRIVTLDHVLKNGDVVEILTSKSAKGPSRD